MNAHPFLLLKRSTADHLIEHANVALARWAAAWTVSTANLASCSAASDNAGKLPPGADWIRRTCANGASVWIHIPSGLGRHVEQMIFKLGEMDATSEKHLPSSIATGVAEEALHDLAEGLITELTNQVSHSAPMAAWPDRMLRTGSGAVACNVTIDGKAVIVLLSAAAIATGSKLSKRVDAPPLVTLQHALKKTPVKLSVEVSRTELTLGYLRTLAVGDVLALPARMDHTMRVVGPGDTTVCHAHLGSLAGNYAIEIIKPVPGTLLDRT